MSIKIINPGLFSTIQDLGRIGYQDQGFSTAGVLDQYAYRTGLALIGNEGPAIECTIIGPTIEFLEDNTFVLIGAEFNATINDISIDEATVIAVKKGDVLKVGQVINGARGYLLFGKPLKIQKVAKSYATHTRSQIGGFKGRPLKSGDVIECENNHSYTRHLGLSLLIDVTEVKENTIQIIEGPQIENFSQEAQQKLVANEFKISEKSDRMGYRLQGETISPTTSADIISEPVALGSIQVPNDGNPIILLNDKQTVGGYTKIATVCASDLHKLAQMQPNDTIRFEWTTIDEAVKKLEQQEEAFKNTIKSIYEQPIFDVTQLRNTSIRINHLLKGEL
ncbi:biotin-dependent carboxyltransferase family protein [Staphylococcus cohnii]|uniref:5-oxoprolinase subunit C family protein n=1 Tax=Staphylococcus cohnii TaxID=29382 RepID=UPI0011A05DBB|nr:biotin-dependent carboxyltransferase family protein [Staphylococcus cohnii]